MEGVYSGMIAEGRVEVTELTALGPGRERDLKSGDEKEATSIRFVNRSSHELKLYWLDNAGKRKAFGTIDPNGSVRQRTFASHAWLVAGADEKAVAIFVASAKRCIAIIKEGPL